MEYFAGLDVSLEKTHVCVLDRTGTVVFETGRMAPMLYHGLADLGVPVVCIESRQAYQALKTLATHKTDRNDARGLAQLARTGFFKPVHVKSLPAHAVRALIMARKSWSASASRSRTRSAGWPLCLEPGFHVASRQHSSSRSSP